MKKSILLLFFSLLSFSFVFSQASNDVLTNKSILDLKTGGFNSGTIVSMIHSSNCSFSVGVNDLLELKKAGLDETVINAMIEKMSGGKTTTPVVSGNTNPVIAELEKQGTGIYYYNKQNLQELEPTVCSQSKSGSGLLTSMTYGIAKTKSKLSVNGAKANIQLNDQKPTFYFYFSSGQGNLNEQGSSIIANATNPNEFMLVRFEKSKSGREITVGSFNYYSGSAEGVDNSNRKGFKFNKVAKGIYEIYFDNPLEPGEYCFMYAGAVHNGTNPKVYDFGIQ
jgi:hypothetical protein